MQCCDAQWCGMMRYQSSILWRASARFPGSLASASFFASSLGHRDRGHLGFFRYPWYPIQPIEPVESITHLRILCANFSTIRIPFEAVWNPFELLRRSVPSRISMQKCQGAALDIHWNPEKPAQQSLLHRVCCSFLAWCTVQRCWNPMVLCTCRKIFRCKENVHMIQHMQWFRTEISP